MKAIVFQRLGYAYGKEHLNLQGAGGRRAVLHADESINLMILESLSELSPTIEQLVHAIRFAERP